MDASSVALPEGFVLDEAPAGNVLPPGFVLDQPAAHAAAPPPLPEGFVLDQTPHAAPAPKPQPRIPGTGPLGEPPGIRPPRADVRPEGVFDALKRAVASPWDDHQRAMSSAQASGKPYDATKILPPPDAAQAVNKASVDQTLGVVGALASGGPQIQPEEIDPRTGQVRVPLGPGAPIPTRKMITRDITGPTIGVTRGEAFRQATVGPLADVVEQIPAVPLEAYHALVPEPGGKPVSEPVTFHDPETGKPFTGPAGMDREVSPDQHPVARALWKSGEAAAGAAGIAPVAALAGPLVAPEIMSAAFAAEGLPGVAQALSETSEHPSVGNLANLTVQGLLTGLAALHASKGVETIKGTAKAELYKAYQDELARRYAAQEADRAYGPPVGEQPKALPGAGAEPAAPGAPAAPTPRLPEGFELDKETPNDQHPVSRPVQGDTAPGAVAAQETSPAVAPIVESARAQDAGALERPQGQVAPTTPVETAATQVAPTGKESLQVQPAQPEPKESRKYEDVQRDIDKREDELEAAGVNVSRLYSPEFSSELSGAPGWQPMPPDLAALYSERDTIGKNDDNQMVAGVNERLTGAVPDQPLRNKLSRQIIEADLPDALRGANQRNSWKDIGRAANGVLKFVAENITHEPDSAWNKVDAILAGTPDNPGIQLRMLKVTGHDNYSAKTVAKAQEILDALMEGNAPRFPRPQEYPSERPTKGGPLGEVPTAISEAERAPGVPREVGPHGPIYHEFYHDAQGALSQLLSGNSGDAIAALHHSGVGDFDLTGDIAAKLRDKHPEVLDDLQGFIDGLDVASQSPNRIQLASSDDQQRAAVRLDFDGKAKRWLLTAFDRGVKRGPTGETTDDSGALNLGEGSIAPTSPAPSDIAPNTSEVKPQLPAGELSPGRAAFQASLDRVAAQTAANKAKLTGQPFGGDARDVRDLRTYIDEGEQMLASGRTHEGARMGKVRRDKLALSIKAAKARLEAITGEHLPSPDELPSDALPGERPPEGPDEASHGPVILGSGLGALESGLRQILKDGEALAAQRKAAMDALSKAKTTPEQKAAGQTALEYFTSEEDLWAAGPCQLFDRARRKLVPKMRTREALTIYREFRSQPEELARFIAGEDIERGHQVLFDHRFRMLQFAEGGKARTQAEKVYAKTLASLQRLKPAMEQALDWIQNGLPDEVAAANKVCTQHATETLEEGQRLHFLESRWKPDQYVPHLLHQDSEGLEPKPPSTRARAAEAGKFFGFGQRRSDPYPTMLHAIADGLVPKTMDVLTAFTIHARTFSRARATHLLEEYLSSWGLGIQAANQRYAQPGWVKLAEIGDEFKQMHAYLDDEQGQPKVAVTDLYVPPFIQKALEPLTSLDPTPGWHLPNLPRLGFAQYRAAQRGLKEAILGLSFFHLATENKVAFYDIGPAGMWKALTSDRDSSLFLENERKWIAHGMTSPVQGTVIEAYRELQPGSIPTRGEIIRAYAGGKLWMPLADAITRLTFDNVQRKFKLTSAELAYGAWLRDNPGSTWAEQEEAMHGIASVVNAKYGGLHWTNMGWTRAQVEVARAIFLAPDWGGSNIALNLYAGYDLELKPKNALSLSAHKRNVRNLLKTYTTKGARSRDEVQGRLARAFWAKQMVGGIAATVAASLLLSGQISPTLKNDAISWWDKRKLQALTSVYLGLDEKGNEVYAQMFFAGDAADAIHLLGKYIESGPAGIGTFVAGKAAPLTRLGLHLATGRDGTGREIASKDLHPVAKLGRYLALIALDLSPVPLTIRYNVGSALEGDKKPMLPAERVVSLGGPQPVHVPPAGTKQTDKGLVQVKPSRRPDNSILNQILTGKAHEPKGRNR